MLTRCTLLNATVAGSAAAALPRSGRVQGRPVIKIGVLNDMSGPYRDATGQGSVVCVQQAVRQFNSSGRAWKPLAEEGCPLAPSQ